MNDEAFLELARRVNNWGRWGVDDQRGTLNLITESHRHDAASLVQSGTSFPLAIPLSSDGPQLGFIEGRTNPTHTMISVFAAMGHADDGGVLFNDDAVQMGLQAATHWDALAHVSYDGRLYNGFPTSTVTADGASRLGAERIGPVVGRGVLLDVARAIGVDQLPGGHALSVTDLEAAESFGRVTVGQGDIVLIRTGQIRWLQGGDKLSYAISTAGPSMQTVSWFHERGVAAVAVDNLSFEVFPGERDDVVLPVHMIHIVEMGLLQGQNFDLEALSEDCADDGRYAFLLSATPEPFVGACGAPVVPVALK